MPSPTLLTSEGISPPKQWQRQSSKPRSKPVVADGHDVISSSARTRPPPATSSALGVRLGDPRVARRAALKRNLLLALHGDRVLQPPPATPLPGAAPHRGGGGHARRCRAPLPGSAQHPRQEEGHGLGRLRVHCSATAPAGARPRRRRRRRRPALAPPRSPWSLPSAGR
jgi:hypothetical protein